MSRYYVLHDSIILYLRKASLMFRPFVLSHSKTRNAKKKQGRVSVDICSVGGLDF